METRLRLDMEKANYELRCMIIHSENLEKDRTTTQEYINKYGMTVENEYGLAKLELLIDRHQLDMKGKRVELMYLKKKLRLNSVVPVDDAPNKFPEEA